MAAYNKERVDCNRNCTAALPDKSNLTVYYNLESLNLNQHDSSAKNTLAYQPWLFLQQEFCLISNSYILATKWQNHNYAVNWAHQHGWCNMEVYEGSFARKQAATRGHRLTYKRLLTIDLYHDNLINCNISENTKCFWKYFTELWTMEKAIIHQHQEIFLKSSVLRKVKF